MKDLTQGSITKNIIYMALPIAVGMLLQTLYFLVDLYFVGALGKVALAGVSAAGNITFFIFGITQILNVGTVALVSQAVGKKDHHSANVFFNQSLMLSVVMGLFVLFAGVLLADWYLSSIAADAETLQVGKTYFLWFLPNLALQFAIVAMSSALRGTGIVKPTMVVQMIAIIINIILSPILISGWGTGYAMGVAGAGLASSIAALVGVILLWRYFHKLEHYVAFSFQLFKPQYDQWKRILIIGFPSGAELMFMFAYMAVIYWAIRDFGSEAQAGFGLGSRIMQAIFLPALAIAFALPAIIGQNFGARQAAQVRESFKKAMLMVAALMFVLTLLAIWHPIIFFKPFSDDPAVLKVAIGFLSIIAFNFIPSGIIFTCSGLFQGFGNTWPSLITTASRMISFVIPAIWLTTTDSFEIVDLWYLSVITVILQSIFSLFFARREMRRHLNLLT
jgi:putative MATE family efflux protein